MRENCEYTFVPEALDSVTIANGRLKLVELERSMGQRDPQNRCIGIIGELSIKVNGSLGM